MYLLLQPVPTFLPLTAKDRLLKHNIWARQRHDIGDPSRLDP